MKVTSKKKKEKEKSRKCSQLTSTNFHHYQERKRQVCQQGMVKITGPSLCLEAETVEHLQMELGNNLLKVTKSKFSWT